MSTSRARAGPRQEKGNLKSGPSQHINQKKKRTVTVLVEKTKE